MRTKSSIVRLGAAFVVSFVVFFFAYRMFSGRHAVPPIAAYPTPIPASSQNETRLPENLDLSRTYETFGMGMLKKLGTDDPNGNIFISPVSLEMAFSLMMMGASPDVRDEMARTLALSGYSEAEIRQKSADYLKTAGAGDDGIVFSVANSIWLQKNAHVRPDFLSANASAFSTKIDTVDLTSTKGIDAVNAWVRKNTHDRIPSVLDQPLGHDDLMAIVNVVYFKGRWADAFSGDATENGPFAVSPAKTVSVPMMKRSGMYEYAETASYQAISLPYGDREDWKMRILLPKNSLSELLDSALPDLLALEKRLEVRDVRLSLPRFSLNYRLELSDVMKSMGMDLAFAPGNRFAGIASETYIARGIHATNLTVDENGTEASAVTALLPRAGGGNPAEIVEMNIDRPFILLIVDGQGVPAFMGIVRNPS